jgi:hypothetical protein
MQTGLVVRFDDLAQPKTDSGLRFTHCEQTKNHEKHSECRQPNQDISG